MRNLPELFTRRPVLSTVFGALILLVGIFGLLNLQVRQYPEVEETVVTITTVYPGASAELIQGFITAPIAASVSTTENVDYVTSASRPSVGTVTVQMQLGADPDIALTEVMSKVQEVRSRLPADAEDPVIVKGTGMQFAIMYLAFQSDRMTPEQVTEYLERVIRPRMSTIDGVAEVQVLGAANYAMRIWIDPVQLAARGVTANDLMQAIGASNFLSAPGSTRNDDVTYSITLESTLHTPEAFGALPLLSDGDEVVRLRDVAQIELAAENTDTVVRFDGRPGTFLGVFPSPSANPLDTAAAVLEELPAIRSSLPEGMTVTLVFDSTEAISASIQEVFITIAQAIVIVILVILLFLGSLRSVLMPVLTIPLSLVGICFFIWAMGYSINLMTLLALVLAIGIVVDDAIVVVENVQRNVSDGVHPLRAAIDGMQELWVALIATTVAIVAVLVPIGLTGGLTGSLFREFAFTLAGAVVISTLVALTITPMMAARMLKGGDPGRFQAVVDRVFEGMSGWYERRVRGSLAVWPVTMFVYVVLIALTGFMFLKTPGELAPEEDAGALFSLVTAPRYATSDYTARYTAELGARTADIPEVSAHFSVTGFGGGNTGFAIWGLEDWADRDRSQAEVQQDIQARLSALDGVEALVFAPPSLPGAGGGLPISMVLQSTGDPSQVYEMAEEIRTSAEATGRFIVVQNSMSYDSPQVTVTIDRDRAAALNVPVRDIGATLSILVGTGAAGQFDRDSRSYDVIPQVPQDYRDNPERLGEFFIRSVTGDMIPLSSVISVSTDAAPAAIEQFDQLNSATISALPMPGVTTGEGMQIIADIARADMPDGFFLDYSGQSRLEIEQGNAMLIAFGAAVLVIYLVLAAQFESFRDPFIVLMSVPLSIFGAILPLNLGLGTLNIYTQIGLITLIGIMAKHGILLVEFANQRRDEGYSIHDAIVRSARIRLRPILMTSLSMVFAMVPLLIADGAGGAARQAIGLVTFWGLLIGTFFTLFVVPMFYILLAAPERTSPDADPVPAE
ncbi:MAG: efflux RND transporter permease subunit [Gemmobacter sp.]